MENKNFTDLDDFGLSGDYKKELFDPVMSSQGEKEGLQIDDFLTSQGSSSNVEIDNLLGDFKVKKTDEFATNEKILEDLPKGDFKFEKPLPAEPIDSTADFLKNESNYFPDVDVHKDDIFDMDENDREENSPSPNRDFDTPSPVPPQIPAHNTRDSPLKHDDLSNREDSPIKGKESPIPPRSPLLPDRDSPQKWEESPTNFDHGTPEPFEVPPFKPVDEFKEPEFIETIPKKQVEPEKPKQTPPPPTPVVKRKHSVEDIGAKDIRVKLDAWFNPARLHPAVESLVYWRDPKKSGIVFGVTLLTLISLTIYSLISVLAYLCFITVLITISFRVYKSIMQAVQKTSDGHPFKEFLDIDLTIPDDKVKEVSLLTVQYINSSVATLRSLFLVEDMIDSIKFALILWLLTYVGACFNGLTLIIIGVILLFSLPKVYENNKAQIDVYIKIAMDKLSIITDKVKTVVPASKNEEKPKDQ